MSNFQNIKPLSNWTGGKIAKCISFAQGIYGSKDDVFYAVIVFKKKKDEELGNTDGIRT